MIFRPGLMGLGGFPGFIFETWFSEIIGLVTWIYWILDYVDRRCFEKL